jgi:hypothetical protein
MPRGRHFPYWGKHGARSRGFWASVPNRIEFNALYGGEIRSGGGPVARNADVAAKLLRDAAQFFLVVGEENPNMLARMTENAELYEAVADLVEEDPEGDLDDD